jgi:hypothetical protein
MRATRTLKPLLLAGTCLLAGCSSPILVPQAVYGVGPVKVGSPRAPAAELLLPLEVDIEAAREFVRIGYGDEFGRGFASYDFQTPGLRTSQAQQLVRLVEQYRSFRGAQVADALGSFKGRVASVAFGRELTPVLYIRLPHWTHQRELASVATEQRRISEEEIQRLFAELRAKFVGELGASEFGAVDGDPRYVRICWR